MIFGLRCSNKDFAYAILDGSKSNPILIDSGLIGFPRNFTRPSEIRWFYQELEEFCNKHPISFWAIKGAEPMAKRDNSFTLRVENEAMVFLIAANKGSDNVIRKVNSSIAKELCHKGKAKYLKTDIDLNDIKNYSKSSQKINEAIIVAWSCF